MNNNIEVINDNLWAVNQYYVKNGYVRELVTFPGCSAEKEDACLRDDGVLILNKASPVYEICKKLMIRIMPYSDDLLKDIYELGEKIADHDPYEFMYFHIIGWEIKRREVQADYMKNYPKTKGRKVIKWLQLVLQ